MPSLNLPAFGLPSEPVADFMFGILKSPVTWFVIFLLLMPLMYAKAVLHQKPQTATFQGIEMVWIRPGSFHMGTWFDEGEASEHPQHKVRISKGFWLGRTEVTQGQWESIMGATRNPSSSVNMQFPVDGVSWHDCQEFIGRLNAKAGDEGRFRLPTEAEWEYACRAGTNGLWYSGISAQDIIRHAWCHDNSASTAAQVGILKSNPWGLYDMLGNVAEWCADWHSDDYYARSRTSNPLGPRSGLFRVVRGGSYRDKPDGCRCGKRGLCGPTFSHEGLGLRLVRDAEP